MIKRNPVNRESMPTNQNLDVGGDDRRVVGVDVAGQAVDDRLRLRLEGAEQPVPDDQDAAVVAVEVLAVGAVVDPVV